MFLNLFWLCQVLAVVCEIFLLWHIHCYFWHVGSSFLTRNGTWAPLHWECRVLVTGPPGKSLNFLFNSMRNLWKVVSRRVPLSILFHKDRCQWMLLRGMEVEGSVSKSWSRKQQRGSRGMERSRLWEWKMEPARLALEGAGRRVI